MKSTAQPDRHSTRNVALWAGIAGIAALFLLLRWNSFSLPFERDEGEYAYSAWLLRNHSYPYENSFMQKPPLIVYCYTAAQFISESSVVVPRVFGTLSAGVSILLTGLGTARIFGRRTGFISAWIMTAMLGFGGINPFAANTEVFMIAPLAGVFFLYASYRDHPSFAALFLAGICGMAAVLFKPISLLLVLFLYILWITGSPKNGLSLFARIAAGASGALLTGLAALAPFLLHDGGRTLWECVITYNSYYATLPAAAGAGLDHYLGMFLKNWWILFLLTAWLLIRRPEMWWLPAGLIVLSVLTIFRSQSGHYYIMLVPFWAMACALALDSLFTSAKNIFTAGAAWKRQLASAVVVGLVLVPGLDQIPLTPDELSLRLYGPLNPFREAREAGREIASMTDSGQYVYVAGSEPEILFYAKRRSPSRFVTAYPLTLPTPLAERYQEEVVNVLRNSPPEMIVFVRSVLSWMQQKGTPGLMFRSLNELIGTRYRLVGGTFAGGNWFDAARIPPQGSNASLLVYKRNDIP